MSWRDNLRPASFRGVPFYIETSKMTLGRRAVKHEFPNRDIPYTQDMGRISNTYSIDGHVLGTDYDLAKKKLEEAFNKFGPGELVHPYYGLKMVQVGAVEFSESTLVGAILSFTVTFEEAGSNDFPKSVNDKAAILAATAATALDKAKASFDKVVTIAKLPGHAVESLRAKVATTQKAFTSATKGVADISDAAAQLAYSTRNLVAETNDLLKSPSNLSKRLLDSFALLKSSISNARIQTDALTSFFGFGSDDVGSDNSTPIRTQESVNKNEYNNFMRRVAVVEACLTAQQAVYETFQEAEEKRIEITAVIEEQIRLTDDPEMYQALVDVHAAIVKALPDADIDFPNLKQITTEGVTTSLHLAYDLFEDPRTEADIITRNKIKNPGLIPNGTVLEVLDGNI